MSVTTRRGKAMIDVAAIRSDFPILALRPYGKPLAYLDSANTSQKPQSVIDRTSEYYAAENANVHRAVHYLAEKATAAYDGVRPKVQRFINAADEREIVFTSGNTDAINLVARSWSDGFLKPGDEILITEMEHHSNIVPWQLACERTGAILKVAPIDDTGEIILEEFDRLVTEKTKFVSVVYVSNSLGTINPVKHLIAMAHGVGAPILLDAAQAGPHLPIDVQDLDCDFLTLAPHKMFGPTGAGVLYGKLKHLDAMPPFKGGGDMIASVTFAKTTYNDVPFKFEAGTPNIAGVVGLGAAIDYINGVGMENIRAWEEDLLAYGNEVIPAVPGLKLIGTAKQRVAVFAFTLESAHPHDISQILNDEGIAVRAGHHCTQPIMEHFGVPATTRASMALYNTREEIDRLVAALHTVNRIFG